MSIKRYDGSNWIEPSTIKRFDGSNWVDIENIKRFDGSNWISVYVRGTKFYFKLTDFSTYSISQNDDGTLKFTGTTKSTLWSVDLIVNYTVPNAQFEITATLANITNCSTFIMGTNNLKGVTVEKTLTTTATSYNTGVLTNTASGNPYISVGNYGSYLIPTGSQISFTVKLDSIVVNGASIPTPLKYDSKYNTSVSG